MPFPVIAASTVQAFQPFSPFAVDRSPRMQVTIGGKDTAPDGSPWPIQEYSYDSDVLQLGDPFSFTLGNADGQYSSAVNLGDKVQLYIADPDVAGGAKNLRLTGLVTGIDLQADRQGGERLLVRGADLGWHLANNSGPLWFNLKGVKFDTFLAKVIDPSWGFSTPARTENNTNRRLNQGRTGAQLAFQPQLGAVLPRIQFEPGETISDTLILYAKRVKKLVNVSADGYLQIWGPAYDGKAEYTLHYHKRSESNFSRNNVKSAHIAKAIDGLYTDVTCVGTVVIPPAVQMTDNPNANKFRGQYKDATTLRFLRRLTFSDGEQLTRDMAAARAKWKWQRGKFDSLVLQYVVAGHSQNGVYYATDTLCEVQDSVHGIADTFYITGIRYNRRLGADGGTTTTLTLRSKGLLAA